MAVWLIVFRSTAPHKSARKQWENIWQKQLQFEMIPSCVTIHSRRAHIRARSIATKANISIKNVPLFTVVRFELPCCKSHLNPISLIRKQHNRSIGHFTVIENTFFTRHTFALVVGWKKVYNFVESHKFFRLLKFSRSHSLAYGLAHGRAVKAISKPKLVSISFQMKSTFNIVFCVHRNSIRFFFSIFCSNFFIRSFQDTFSQIAVV